MWLRGFVYHIFWYRIIAPSFTKIIVLGTNIGTKRKTFLDATGACTLAKPLFHADNDFFVIEMPLELPELDDNEKYWVGYHTTRVEFCPKSKYNNMLKLLCARFKLNSLYRNVLCMFLKKITTFFIYKIKHNIMKKCLASGRR